MTRQSDPHHVRDGRQEIVLNTLNRRSFLAATTAACLTGISDRAVADDVASNREPWIRKSSRSTMFYGGGSVADQFSRFVEAGFDGIQMSVPMKTDNEVEEVAAASESTGLKVDGTFANYDLRNRYSDSDRDVRRVALRKLETSIEQTAAMGGHSIQINPGHGFDGREGKVHQRIREAIESALPTASDFKVSILLKNSLNKLFYDPNGGQDQDADGLAEFVQGFDSPRVGIQFDIPSAYQLGDPAKWIKTLGPLIQKLDIKGYSRRKKSYSKIGDGDLDWDAIQTSLQEVGFTGWCIADFGRSSTARLKEITGNMETVLNCSQPVATVPSATVPSAPSQN
jgi:hexulose-6-phosphate isomerase